MMDQVDFGVCCGTGATGKRMALAFPSSLYHGRGLSGFPGCIFKS